ncbi:MAG: hypothetical protein HY958_10250 [Bacteroidia bacterium]|nr:hypothetical protein [Bacteroidia bacterium]
MKKLFVTLCVTLVFASPFLAQLKVIEDSGRKPKWVGGVVKDYVIGVGTGKDIEVAKTNCLTDIKSNIAKSVADYVKSSSELNKTETNGKNVASYFETYSANVQSETADIPSLKGISLSKAEEFYWEKVQNKSTGAVVVNYHIKYPFSEMDLRKIIMEFEKVERELNEKLEEIIMGADTIASVEEMISNIAQLESMLKSFKDNRKTKVEGAIAKYSTMLSSISLVPIKNDIGDLSYATKLGERFVYTMQKPRVTSYGNCAQTTSITSERSNWFIVYKYANCFDDPANAVNVEYMFNGKKVSNKFNFDINKNKVDIFLKNDINITTVQQEGNAISESKCELTFVSKHATPVLIEKVILDVQGAPPIIFNNVNQEFEGKGDHEIVLKCTQRLEKNKYSSNNQSSSVNGSINWKNKATGEKGTYKIFDQKFTTDWQ